MFLAAPTLGAGEAPPLPEALRSAPANTWVEVVKGDKSGQRFAPVFFYEPASKKIIRAAGSGPGVPFWDGDANTYDRYDTEELDLAAGRWVNAYPPGMEKGRPESGEVSGYKLAMAKDAHARQARAWDPGLVLGLDGDRLRIKNWPVFHQWAYVPEKKKLYATFGFGSMVTYEPERRAWAELKVDAGQYKGGARWCALAHDPVNGELVQVGGHGGENGTWLFDLDKSEWRRLNCGSAAMKELGSRGAGLRWRAICLLGAAANRFSVAETDEEAKADLAAEARGLGDAMKKLGADVAAARVDENEKAGIGRAGELLADLAARYGNLAARLGGKLDAAVLGELRALKFTADRACDALAVEPPPRGLSPAVYDPERRKIVVFGGDQLDRTFSDTWLYDCPTRRWEQRFPLRAPCPRAGHLMVWLPEARRVFLAGGYSRVPFAQDMWSYDVAANAWSFHGAVPLKDGPNYSKLSPGVPNASRAGYPITGAAMPGDIVVGAGPLDSGLMACRADVSRADPGGAETNGVVAGSYTLHPTDPGKWENLAKPDPEANLKFLKEMPVNQWHALKFPAYAPGAGNRWGTVAYDHDRQQLLLWSGGHASSWEDDVDHFSVRGGVWTVSYPPDACINPHGTLSPWAGYGGVRTFSNRVVPGHAYRYVAYDPSGYYLAGANGFRYDVRAREWAPPGGPAPGKTVKVTTPHGVVGIVEGTGGAVRYNSKSGEWDALPWEGPKPRKFYCDSYTVAYDAKRDCLWSFDDQVIRYDFKTGKSELMKPGSRPRFGDWYLCRESVCLPEADLVLSPLTVKAKGGWTTGWVAWDLTAQKYLAVDLPRDEVGRKLPTGRMDTTHADGFDMPHCGLVYDAKLDIVLCNDIRRQQVWVLRFDRKTVKIADAE